METSETPNSLNFDRRHKAATLNTKSIINHRHRVALYEKVLGSQEKEPTGEQEEMTGSRAHLLNMDLRADYGDECRKAREADVPLTARLAFWRRVPKSRAKK